MDFSTQVLLVFFIFCITVGIAFIFSFITEKDSYNSVGNVNKADSQSDENSNSQNVEPEHENKDSRVEVEELDSDTNNGNSTPRDKSAR